MGNVKEIAPSELILNPDGTIYHLNLKPENLADIIILVGDPKRVEVISSFFDSIEFKGMNREICTHTGHYKGKRLTIMSSGMGADNIDIVMNELDALVNIDLKTRTEKEDLRSLTIFRLGTSGAVQPELPVNSFIVSAHSIGFDSVMHFYEFSASDIEIEIYKKFLSHMNWDQPPTLPYVVSADKDLLDFFDEDFIYKGITLTAPGFYGPQGRRLRKNLAYPEINKQLEAFRFRDFQILNYEMETSALYGMGNLLGHRTLTICLAIANRYSKNFNQKYHDKIKELTQYLLDKILQLD